MKFYLQERVDISRIEELIIIFALFLSLDDDLNLFLYSNHRLITL